MFIAFKYFPCLSFFVLLLLNYFENVQSVSTVISVV